MVALEGGEQFGREARRGGRFEVGPEDEVSVVAGANVSGGLHLLVDDEEISGAPGLPAGKSDGAEGLAVDGAGDATAKHVGPGGANSRREGGRRSI